MERRYGEMEPQPWETPYEHLPATARTATASTTTDGVGKVITTDTKDDDNDILRHININLDTETNYDEHIFTHINPIKDIVFDHEYMEKEIAHYNLSFSGCSKCCEVSQHFQDIQGACDAIATKDVTWLQMPGSTMTCPAPSLKTKLYEPQNMNLKLNKNRPRGYIQVKRLPQDLPNNQEFLNMARHQSIGILQGLKGKPLVTQELNFKI